jgi:DNA-binding FadR family transcriptional regulator
MARKTPSSDFIQYLSSITAQEDTQRIPPLTDLSQELGVSVARLREQLEVARALGFVEVRPKTGIRRLAYKFYPAVSQSLSYALEIDRSFFATFSDLRNHLEEAYWFEAVERLQDSDRHELKQLVHSAWDKLRLLQIQIPHKEHRQLHLTIFRRLDNLFVQGILEAYWEAYEAVDLNHYSDYEYLQLVWTYHQQMVDAIVSQDYQAGYTALVEHKDLLYHRPVAGHEPIKLAE